MATADAIRDAYALVQTSLAGDEEGSAVIKRNAADLGEVTGVLATRSPSCSSRWRGCWSPMATR
jgi:hypothetical protein